MMTPRPATLGGLLLVATAGLVAPALASRPPQSSQASGGAPPVPWKQDRYAISFWVDPVVPPARFDAEYHTVAQANFTVLLGGFGATTRGAVTQQIAAATKAGLVPVPSICGGACANMSGAWGF